MRILDKAGTLLTAKAHQGLSASRLRLACAVAIAIGISMSLAEPIDHEARKMPTPSDKQLIRALADYQLTDLQFHCHNEIAYRESRWNFKAINGSHYGYMQGKNQYLKTAVSDQQFWWHWKYVSNRYGITRYDEPNYCNALKHLRRYGWQ